MGASGRANDKGVLELLVESYKTGKQIGLLRIENLEPNEPVQVEWTEGEPR